MLSKLALLAGLVGLAAADTCTTIEATAASIDVVRELNPSYTSTLNDYWSTSCTALKPSCILYPSSPREVSAILGVLSASNNTERFAVKSGGHNPNNYWSSVQGGPLISTDKLDHVLLDPDTGVVRVGPGNRWTNVAEALDGSGWSVVGGRLSDVGVGGYLVGGGLSFMSGQHGWAADSVLEYELVLANGTVVTASEDANHDIWLALRGGGNNFGVVTSFTVQAYRQDDVFGGVMVFTASDETDARILAAIRDFTVHNRDGKASLIPAAVRSTVDLVDAWFVFTFYDGPEPPEGIFKNFTDAGPTINTSKRRSYADLVKTNNWAIIRGSVYMIGTETVPLPPPASDVNVLEEVHAHWRNVTDDVQWVGGITASIGYQPFSRAMARVAREKGGDLLDLDDDVDYIVLEVNSCFFYQKDYERMAQALRDVYEGARGLVEAWMDEGVVDAGAHTPLFANDAFHEQDLFARMRPEHQALARSVADDLDPEGLFRDRTGGWKP
ncbi:hypothetical protein N3K66_005292 [Trichothecium roseum]|uniref:Uncharacterized protein n=1 Tax=Trichothecium roseum TaxID=47278 RepID=A0ACC0UXN8_9HYPO|nr:hypothetical protein N3K66_005292 [Trichothecium roseum]